MNSNVFPYHPGTVPEMLAAMRRAVADGGECLVVDLAAIGSVDATVARELIVLLRRSREWGADVALTGANSDVSRSLAAMALDRIFTMVNAA
jgi:anti-anti-sigma regulatory factor